MLITVLPTIKAAVSLFEHRTSLSRLPKLVHFPASIGRHSHTRKKPSKGPVTRPTCGTSGRHAVPAWIRENGGAGNSHPYGHCSLRAPSSKVCLVVCVSCAVGLHVARRAASAAERHSTASGHQQPSSLHDHRLPPTLDIWQLDNRDGYTGGQCGENGCVKRGESLVCSELGSG